MSMLPDQTDIYGSARAIRMEFRALLEQAEWCGDGERCIYCGSTKAVGIHATTCELGKLLDNLYTGDTQ